MKIIEKCINTTDFLISNYMEFLNELGNNQPNILIGFGVATLVLLGIYIKLLNIYQ